jgi:hypothetical protein
MGQNVISIQGLSWPFAIASAIRMLLVGYQAIKINKNIINLFFQRK